MSCPERSLYFLERFTPAWRGLNRLQEVRSISSPDYACPKPTRPGFSTLSIVSQATAPCSATYHSNCRAISHIVIQMAYHVLHLIGSKLANAASD